MYDVCNAMITFTAVDERDSSKRKTTINAERGDHTLLQLQAPYILFAFVLYLYLYMYL